jgi:uncharacterized membrane protein YfcA
MTDPLTVQRDTDQLNLLAIFHFIGAALSLLGMGFLFVHFTFMNSLFGHPELWANQSKPPPPQFLQFFEMFRWFYAFFGIFLIACAIGNLMSAFSLRTRKNRTFSIAVGALNCLHMPLGTVLGVFTIIVLMRDSVRMSYEKRSVRD